MIPLSNPDITEREIQAVCDVLRTPNLSLGPKLPEFENAFTKYIGVKRAVAVNSGTSGLFLCMQAMNIGEGDEVITAPFTFIATSNIVMMTGATPVFVDIEPVSMNIDTSKIEKKITSKTKALLPVEAFGNPYGFDKVVQIAEKHNIPIVEDCCEALGSGLNGIKCGKFGKVGVFAFYPNKQMTTGEGGMIVTDDDNIADMCMSLRNQGRGVKGAAWLAHERLGYNYRLSDINCALGVVQISRIEEFKAKRRQVANWYQEMLGDDKRLIVPKELGGCDVSWFVFVVRLSDNYTIEHRNKILEQMRASDIQVSNYFTPVHLQPFMVEKYGFKKGDFPVTEFVSERTIALPFYNNLKKEQIETVSKTLKEILNKI
jgi:perosamine synthetase